MSGKHAVAYAASLGNATAQPDATGTATEVQPKRLKALAGAVLERNRQRNCPATEGVEVRNFSATDAAAESRRGRVLAMLDQHPTCRYAVLTQDEGDPEAVILTLAIRGRATCELAIPRAKYDGVLLLDLIEQHGGTIH